MVNLPLEVNASAASLNSIGRLHPRRRLLVSPPRWTSLQLELLDCHFEDDVDDGNAKGDGIKVEIENTKAEKAETGEEEGEMDDEESGEVGGMDDDGKGRASRPARASPSRVSLVMRSPAERLAAADVARDAKHVAARQLFDAAFDMANSRLSFYFNGRAGSKINSSIFCSTKAYPIYEPRVAYVDYVDLETRRRRTLQSKFLGANIDWEGSSPGAVLFRKNFATLTPAHWSRDPLLVSLLISLAQAQRKFQRLRTSHDSRFATSTSTYTYLPIVLLTHGADACIHLYRANMPAEFLTKFDEPSRQPATPTRVTVTHSRIPFRPFKTFKSRLMEKLRRLPRRGWLRHRHRAAGTTATVALADGDPPSTTKSGNVTGQKRRRASEGSDADANRHRPKRRLVVREDDKENSSADGSLAGAGSPDPAA
ncbi:hypothetical protein RJ55_04246 [Drechmeria coniospora]|nr:hypothetical protein RJ55_04246 [Drechmeria coniospora]